MTTLQTLMQDPLLQKVPGIEGYRVLGKTILLAHLGTGGMGVVYRGWHLAFRIDVAVKVLKASLAADREYVLRFRHEAEAALRITHQHVVRAYDVEERHGLHYLVMEFIDGESAAQRVRRAGRMQPREAITVVTATAAGLAEAHGHGLVHRDVKPNNVLIARSGRVRIADLGLVRPALEAREEVASGEKPVMLGTRQYMAPEQWGSRDVHPAADVWAVGATLHYLLTGAHGVPRLPTAQVRQWVQENAFPTLRERFPDLPDELHRVYERCVERDPAKRFQNAGELHTALQSLGMNDEALLRDRDYDPAKVATDLPSNEVLGRISARLKHATGAVPEPQVQERPAARRRRPSAGRKSSALPLAVLLLTALGTAIVVLTRRSGSSNGDTASPTAIAPPAVAPAPAPQQTPVPAVPIPRPEAREPAPPAVPTIHEPAKPAMVAVAPPTIEWRKPEIGVRLSGTVTVEVAVASTVPLDAVHIGSEKATCSAPVDSGTSLWSADIALAADGMPITVKVVYAAGKETSIESARIGVELAGDALPTTIGILMQPIAPSEFPSGASLVQITRPFWIGQEEVSRGQWRALMPAADGAGDDAMPIANIPWADAVEFCRRLTQRERASGRLPKGYEYGLPPEAWWECACRANDDGATPGSHVDTLVAVHVGTLGAVRLRNMHGNVAEWCLDDIATAVWPKTVRDPIGAVAKDRVARGVAYTDLEQPTAQVRQGWPAATGKKKIGFRTALLPLPASK